MKVISKDILTVESGIICQQVNAEGWMGAGLAMQIRNKWPVVYDLYRGSVPRLGEIQTICISGIKNLWVFNLCAQRTVGIGVQIEYVHFIACLKQIRERVVPTYFPWMIGCGLAGGDWNTVIRILLDYVPDAILCVKPE